MIHMFLFSETPRTRAILFRILGSGMACRSSYSDTIFSVSKIAFARSALDIFLSMRARMIACDNFPLTLACEKFSVSFSSFFMFGPADVFLTVSNAPLAKCDAVAVFER